MTGARALRNLLDKPDGLVSIGVFDCFSAKIAQHAGFPLVSISGNTLTASLLGLPDLGLTTMTEVAAQAHNIANSVDVPVLADGDTGFGNALNVTRTVREFESAGVAGVSIEDQVFPKRSSSIGKPGLISIGEAVAKIEAACLARRSDDFLIIGRTDARTVEGLDQAIARARRYCQAGADIIFINSLQAEEEMRRATDSVPRPVKINVSEGTPASKFTSKQLIEFGFRIVGYSGFMQRAAGHAMLRALDVFKAEGGTEGGMRPMLMSKAERYAVLDLERWKQLESKLAAKQSAVED